MAWRVRGGGGGAAANLGSMQTVDNKEEEDCKAAGQTHCQRLRPQGSERSMKSLHALGHQIWNYRCGTDASGNGSCVLVVELSSVFSVSWKKEIKTKERPCNFVSLDSVNKKILCWRRELE